MAAREVSTHAARTNLARTSGLRAPSATPGSGPRRIRVVGDGRDLARLSDLDRSLLCALDLKRGPFPAAFRVEELVHGDEIVHGVPLIEGGERADGFPIPRQAPDELLFAKVLRHTDREHPAVHARIEMGRLAAVGPEWRG